jgi:ketopantoate reductase
MLSSNQVDKVDQKIKGPLRLAVVGAAGNVGTHIAALWANGIRAYFQRQLWVGRDELHGQYSDVFLQAKPLFALFDRVLQRFHRDDGLPIQLDLILNKPVSNQSSSAAFQAAKGFGFYAADCDDPLGDNLKVKIPVSDYEALNIQIIDDITSCEEAPYHLVVTVVKEHALLDETFCKALGAIVHPRGQLALSMNGVPPYFKELFESGPITDCDLQTSVTRSGDNILTLLGGADRMIGVVLTVADSLHKIPKDLGGYYHVSKSSKARSECKLGSRQVILNSQTPYALPVDFFQSMGIATGLGAKIELFFAKAIVQKLAVNFVLNPVATLMPVTIGQLLDDRRVHHFIRLLNDQFIFMTSEVLGIDKDILYPGEVVINRLKLSKNHIASSGQSVRAGRPVEYVSLKTFLDVVLQVAKLREMEQVPALLAPTIKLFALFEVVCHRLNQSSDDYRYETDGTMQEAQEQFSQLLDLCQMIDLVKTPAVDSSERHRQISVQMLANNMDSAIQGLKQNMAVSEICLVQYASNLSLMTNLDGLPVLPDSTRQTLTETLLMVTRISEAINGMIGSSTVAPGFVQGSVGSHETVQSDAPVHTASLFAPKAPDDVPLKKPYSFSFFEVAVAMSLAVGATYVASR